MTGPSKSTVYCTHCPKMCRFACPVAEATGNERHTPWAKQATLHGVLRGQRPLDADAARSFFACLECSGTVAACKHGIDASVDLRDGRRRAVEAGVYRPGRALARRFAAGDNGLFGATAGRLAELLPDADPSADWLLWPGCAGLAGAGDDVRAAARLLAATGDRYAALPEILCAGYPLAALGETEALEAHRRRLAGALAGRRRILSLCLACRPELERAAGPSATVVSPLERAASLVADGRLAPGRRPGRAAYHAPCREARRPDPIDGQALVERLFEDGAAPLLWSGRESRCCGGGGALPVTHPRTAHRILSRRVDEFEATGAGRLVTSCSTCLRRFRRVMPPDRVHDLVDLIVEAAAR